MKCDIGTKSRINMNGTIPTSETPLYVTTDMDNWRDRSVFRNGKLHHTSQVRPIAFTGDDKHGDNKTTTGHPSQLLSD